MQVAVLGPGGVGGFLAGVLARAEVQVLILAGEETARAIAESGIRVESKIAGDFHVTVETATRLSHPVDACLVTVKATQLHDALDRVPREALGDALAIPFLNGLEHVDQLRTIYPPDQVVAGTIAVETVRLEAGVIRQISPFARVEFAPSAHTRERVEELAAALRQGGLDVRLRNDERAMLWDKFAMLAPSALMTTHERANVGQVRTRRREDFVALLGEVATIANADGGSADASRLIQLWDLVPETFETSMQRDQAAGRALELDAIGGALLRAAARHDIPVPVATRIVDDLGARTGVKI